MELQLGLALPYYINPIKAFDLNKQGYESKEVVAASLEPLTALSCGGLANKNCKHKRCFEETVVEYNKDMSSTLPLLLLNDHPNKEDDDADRLKKRNSCPSKTNDEENSQVVGWPPIKSWRKKVVGRQQGGRMENIVNGGPTALYVKVKMEGVAVSRKLDLTLYDSYKTLTISLISMFAKHEKCDKDVSNFTLTYQDKDGDWLLAGDLPWQTFVESVQRLKIVKNKC